MRESSETLRWRAAATLVQLGRVSPHKTHMIRHTCALAELLKSLAFSRGASSARIPLACEQEREQGGGSAVGHNGPDHCVAFVRLRSPSIPLISAPIKSDQIRSSCACTRMSIQSASRSHLNSVSTRAHARHSPPADRLARARTRHVSHYCDYFIIITRVCLRARRPRSM